MDKQPDGNPKLRGTLRERAEQLLRAGSADMATLPTRDVKAVVHELHVHQMELEMQNEELLQAQVELAHTRDRYADLYEFAPVGYVTLGENGKILEANLAFAAILGVERQALLQANISKFVARVSQDDYYLHRQAVFSAENLANSVSYSEKQTCEIEMHKSDGTPLMMRLESIAFDTEHGRQCRTALIDITAQKQIESALKSNEQRLQQAYDELRISNEQLLAAARAKDAFLTSMSHELRTPLNAILGFAELMEIKSGAALNSDQQRFVRTIHQSGLHLLELIDDILDLAQVAAGEMKLVFKEVPLDTVCRAALQLIKQAADKKQLLVSVSIDRLLPAMWADERRLKQILVNLLSNAVKFTPQGGRVGLEVNEDNGNIRFLVWDTGIGIAADAMTHLFKPFMQLDSRIASEFGGVGLGLSLVYHMVEMHGGRISVESVVGEGSRFMIFFPARSAARPEAMEITTPSEKFEAIPAAISAPADTARKLAGQALILVAEDNEHNALILVEFLQSEGYRVLTAQDGHEAIRHAHEYSPDLILMDIQMPGMDGLEAIRRLRTEARFDDLPIVALTAQAMPRDQDRCLAAGASTYLSKPVRLLYLAKQIEGLLKG